MTMQRGLKLATVLVIIVAAVLAPFAFCGANGWLFLGWLLLLCLAVALHITALLTKPNGA